MKHILKTGTLAASVATVLLVSGCNGSNSGQATAEQEPAAAAQEPAAIVQEQASIEGMRILLTNDDSIINSRANGGDGKGLFVKHSVKPVPMSLL